jgi:mono/diheme cytochrome c family protein
MGRPKGASRFIAAAVLSLALMAGPAWAGDPRAPRGMIAEHCVECHRVPGFLDSARSPEIGAPDFEEIARDRKTYTAERLKAFLRKPHFPMRQFTMSESDVDNIVTFIFAIREPPEVN